MQSNLVSMARELEKLRAEIANAEKRARAAAAAAVGNPGTILCSYYSYNTTPCTQYLFILEF